MPVVQLQGYRCARCSWEWLPRSERKPTICPRCKSPYWDRERMRERNEPEGKSQTATTK
jgi:predicted Zn-ribbon and HTH transcriptional regulator